MQLIIKKKKKHKMHLVPISVWEKYIINKKSIWHVRGKGYKVKALDLQQNAIRDI